MEIELDSECRTRSRPYQFHHVGGARLRPAPALGLLAVGHLRSHLVVEPDHGVLLALAEAALQNAAAFWVWILDHSELKAFVNVHVRYLLLTL